MAGPRRSWRWLVSSRVVLCPGWGSQRRWLWRRRSRMKRIRRPRRSESRSRSPKAVACKIYPTPMIWSLRPNRLPALGPKRRPALLPARIKGLSPSPVPPRGPRAIPLSRPKRPKVSIKVKAGRNPKKGRDAKTRRMAGMNKIVQSAQAKRKPAPPRRARECVAHRARTRPCANGFGIGSPRRKA